jgi:hypothetical protein
MVLTAALAAFISHQFLRTGKKKRPRRRVYYSRKLSLLII